jgi:hypothetical protein
MDHPGVRRRSIRRCRTCCWRRVRWGWARRCPLGICLYEKEAALGLPEGVHSYAILPIGYPMGRFGPVGWGALADFVYQDKWGQPWAGL